jgi:hypothetical protein
MLFGAVSFALTLSLLAGPAPAAQKSNPPGKGRAPLILNGKTPQPKPGQRKKLVFKEELSIGQAEGDENYMFGEFVAFNTDREGNFYVTDIDKKRIQKYDPAGKYLGRIGNAGQGPGEFQSPGPARFDQNGDLYVSDIMSKRLVFFESDGRYLRQVTFVDYYEDLYITSGGNYVARRTRQSLSDKGIGQETVAGVFDPKLNLVAEFYSRKTEYPVPRQSGSNAQAKFLARILSDIAFRPAQRHSVNANDLVFFGFSEKYEIRVYDGDGGLQRTLARDYDPIKVRDRDKAAFLDGIAGSMLNRVPGVNRQEVANLVEYPKFKPAYYGFAPLEDGWLLVCVETVPGDHSLFDLFDDRGVYVGQFTSAVPPDGLFFNNGKAYSVETVDDYKYIKRYGFKVVDY